MKPILYDERSGCNYVTEETSKNEWSRFYLASKMEGHFRFEVAEEESVQITAIDGSGTLHSQFTKDGTAKDFGICDAENVTFQMKGFFKPNLEVELTIKILHFNED